MLSVYSIVSLLYSTSYLSHSEWSGFKKYPDYDPDKTSFDPDHKGVFVMTEVWCASKALKLTLVNPGVDWKDLLFADLGKDKHLNGNSQVIYPIKNQQQYE